LSPPKLNYANRCAQCLVSTKKPRPTTRRRALKSNRQEAAAPRPPTQLGGGKGSGLCRSPNRGHGANPPPPAPFLWVQRNATEFQNEQGEKFRAFVTASTEQAVRIQTTNRQRCSTSASEPTRLEVNHRSHHSGGHTAALRNFLAGERGFLFCNSRLGRGPITTAVPSLVLFRIVLAVLSFVGLGLIL
jgi:hypothetical protein